MNRVTISWPPEHQCIVLLRRYAEHRVSESLTIRSRPGICIAAEMLRAQTHARSIWQLYTIITWEKNGKNNQSFSKVLRSWIQWMIQRRFFWNKNVRLCLTLAASVISFGLDNSIKRHSVRLESQIQEAKKPWFNYGAHWLIMLDLFQSCRKLGLVKLNSRVPDLNHCLQGIFPPTKALQGQLPRF